MSWLILMFTASIQIYFIPALITYFGVRWRYKNEWKHSSPDLNDVILVIVPLLNWIGAIWILLELMFAALDKSFDSLDSSEVNKKIKGKDLGKKLFKL